MHSGRAVLLACAVALCAMMVHAVPLNQDEQQSSAPAMGWRSWNAFMLDVSDPLMRAQVDAVAAPGPNGGKSLAELGYGRIGVDDGWQDCGAGMFGSFHNWEGQPLVNKSRFPDLLSMTRYAHSKNVKMGWYLNNCWCNENGHTTAHYENDVKLVVDAEFDGVKIDGCGPAHDINKWTDAIAKSKASLLVENCGDNHKSWSPPLPSELETCKFNLYRISSDIAPQFYSTMYNLQHQVPFQDLTNPMSRPGCWAYPDMLQVGNRLNTVESRSHFGAWCVTSSPLILGFDLTNKALYDEIYPLISNEDAIAVNQAWAGHPGHLALSSNTTFEAPVAHGAECSCCNDLSKCEKTTFPQWQVWVKPLDHLRTAVFIVNISENEVAVDVPLSIINDKKIAQVYNVWEKKTDSPVQEHIKIDKLAAHDSVFLILQ